MSTPPCEVVQVDALVALKIIKHCRDALPEMGIGQLMGLPVENVLEVTNSFNFPNKKPTTQPRRGKWADEEKEDDDDDSAGQYQMEMMRCLREVNVDNNVAGWYQATYLGNFMTQTTIETQYNYQQSIPSAVVLVYDPLKTEQGTFSLRAYRLSKQFCELYRRQDFSSKALSHINFKDIFVEVAVTIRNTWLDKGLLFRLLGPDYKSETIGRMDLATQPFLEKNMELLLECVDDLNKEQSQYAYHQRNHARQQQILLQLEQKLRLQNAAREQEGLPPLTQRDFMNDPQYAQALKTSQQQTSRFENLLITSQINSFCESIDKFAGKSFTKLFATRDLNPPMA